MGTGRVVRRYNTAEAIADVLRSRILSGEVPDGGVLPKLEDLIEEFGVSRATVRQACQVLETEGLLRVRRGNVGGSVVHVPGPANAAYVLGQVLEARQVDVADVRAAVGRFEPVCVELCAERADRAEIVLPPLRAAQDDLLTAIEGGDGTAAAAAARRWHESLVATCGNETMSVLLGTLEAIWTSHARTSAAASRARGEAFSPDSSRQVHAEHEHIQERLEAGDAAGAAAAARAHLRTARIHPSAAGGEATPVRAVTVRDELFGWTST